MKYKLNRFGKPPIDGFTFRASVDRANVSWGLVVFQEVE